MIKQLKLLFCDDLPSEVSEVRRLLEDTLHFRVFGATTLIEAEDALICNPDVVVVDYSFAKSIDPADHMRGGFRLVRHVREQPQFDRVPIIVTSAWWDTEQQSQFDGDNICRGVFTIQKSQWGQSGAGLIAAVGQALFAWSSFIAIHDPAMSSDAFSTWHRGMRWPLRR